MHVQQPTCTKPSKGNCTRCSAAVVVDLRTRSKILTADTIINDARMYGGVCWHPRCGRTHCVDLLRANYNAGNQPLCTQGVTGEANDYRLYRWCPVPGLTTPTVSEDGTEVRIKKC